MAPRFRDSAAYSASRAAGSLHVRSPNRERRAHPSPSSWTTGPSILAKQRAPRWPRASPGWRVIHCDKIGWDSQESFGVILMSVVKHASRGCSFRRSGDRNMGCAVQEDDPHRHQEARPFTRGRTSHHGRPYRTERAAPPQARWQGLGIFASGGSTPGWPILKSCRMNLLPEISVARLALLSRSRRQRGMTGNGVSFRSLSSRKGVTNAENQAQAHQTLHAKNQRKGRTLRPDLLAGMGEAGPRFRQAKPVGMAGGGLRQTLQPFIKTGRCTVAFPPPLQASSASLRHQRMPPDLKDPNKQPIETRHLERSTASHSPLRGSTGHDGTPSPVRCRRRSWIGSSPPGRQGSGSTPRIVLRRAPEPLGPQDRRRRLFQLRGARSHRHGSSSPGPRRLRLDVRAGARTPSRTERTTAQEGTPVAQALRTRACP
jgi:hypothetical protein